MSAEVTPSTADSSSWVAACSRSNEGKRSAMRRAFASPSPGSPISHSRLLSSIVEWGSTCYLKRVVSSVSRRLFNPLTWPSDGRLPGGLVGIRRDFQEDPLGARAKPDEQGRLLASHEFRHQTFVRESPEERLPERLGAGPVRLALPGKETGRIHAAETPIIKDADKTEFDEFRGDLAHGLSGEPHAGRDLLEREARDVGHTREDRGPTGRGEGRKERHVPRIDESGGKDAHALRLEVSVLDEVPRVPAHGRGRPLQVPTDVSDPGAGSKAQVPEHLPPPRVREAATLAF